MFSLVTSLMALWAMAIVGVSFIISCVETSFSLSCKKTDHSRIGQAAKRYPASGKPASFPLWIGRYYRYFRSWPWTESSHHPKKMRGLQYQTISDMVRFWIFSITSLINSSLETYKIRKEGLFNTIQQSIIISKYKDIIEDVLSSIVGFDMKIRIRFIFEE